MKNNHPAKRIIEPNEIKIGLCEGKIKVVFGSNLYLLGLRNMVTIMAAIPAAKKTIPEPEKSLKPNWLILIYIYNMYHPPANVQWTNAAYMNPE